MWVLFEKCFGCNFLKFLIINFHHASRSPYRGAGGGGWMPICDMDSVIIHIMIIREDSNTVSSNNLADVFETFFFNSPCQHCSIRCPIVGLFISLIFNVLKNDKYWMGQQMQIAPKAPKLKSLVPKVWNLSLKSLTLAIVTPSSGIFGLPQDRSMTTSLS